MIARTCPRTSLLAVILLASALLPSQSLAQSCDAYFKFDGDLSDASGNGYDGSMIGPEGAPATARFSAGIDGQALQFDGTSAMRAYLDLSPDLCPKVTIAGWVRVDATQGRGTQYIVSTGQGHGPGLRANGTTAGLSATGNGLSQRDAYRDKRAWFFFAGVYDYEEGKYRFHWRDRVSEGSIADSRRPPEDSFWVGAYNDRLSYAIKGAQIDELRVIGKTLTREEVARLRGGRPAAFVALGGQAGGSIVASDAGGATGSSTGFPQPVPGISDQLATTDRQIDPGVLPERPPDLMSGGISTSESGTPLLETPEGLGAANDGIVNPDLAAPDDLPSVQLPGTTTATSDTALLEVPDEVQAANEGLVNPDLTAPENTLADQLEEATRPRDAPPPPPSAPTYSETYSNTASGPVRTVDIVLPGRTVAQTITYQEIDGLAVTEGDIVLGTIADLDQWKDAVQPEATGEEGVRRQGLNAIANTAFLWPQGRIPYDIAAGLSSAESTKIFNAVNTINAATNLRFFRRTSRFAPSQRDYVEFVQGDDPVACSSRVGKQGGRQEIKVSTGGCRVDTYMHEMLHAAGVWHEQSRPDRDTFVQVLMNNVQTDPEDRRHNFEKHPLDDAIGVGTYNFSSIMHYSPFAFGVACTPNPPNSLTDPNCGCNADASGNPTNCASRTIRPRNAANTIVRDLTLASDVADINALYPATVGPQMGLEWGDENYGTATAVGDVDGDGRGEVIVGRFANSDARLFVYDDAVSSHQLLATEGTSWGAGVEVTDIAVGDVDGDGVMEIGVTRRSGENNRWYIYRYASNQLTELRSGGDDWGSAYYATSIAFGDIDNDGRDEFAVGRRAGESGRYYLFNDAAASQPFQRLAIGGSDWGSGNYTTALAFGDIDNDGRDELGVARRAGESMRYEVVSYANGQLTQVHSGGQDWGSSYYATAIAFGNVDGDPEMEFIVGRRAAESSRFFVIDDGNAGFSTISTGGAQWGSSYFVTGVALADVDNDGRDEVLVARNAGENGRYYVFNDGLRNFVPITVSGAPLFSGVGATDIAAGDMDNDNKEDLAITYDEKTNTRMRWETIYMNPPGT